MGKFRKKPIVIEAMQFDGDNHQDVFDWMDEPLIEYTTGHPGAWETAQGTLVISTYEGEMEAQPEDWIIRGIKGEYYPCKPDIFDATYEPVA